MKTSDHFWTDPSADELVQRHRIHSLHLRQDSPTKRPALCVSVVDGGALGGSLAEFWTWYGGGEWTGALVVTPDLICHLPAHCQIQKRHSSSSMDDRPSLSARDYVESLHQNSRATLLYGKNNVLVQPVRVRLGPSSSTGGLAPGYRGGVPSGSWLLIHRSIHPFTHLFIHLSKSPPTQPVYSLPVSVFTHPSIYASITISLSICLYLYPPNHLFIHPSIYPSLRPSIHLPIITSIHPPIIIFIYSSIHLLIINPSLHLSICFPVHLSIHLSTQLSIILCCNHSLI